MNFWFQQDKIIPVTNSLRIWTKNQDISEIFKILIKSLWEIDLLVPLDLFKTFFSNLGEGSDLPYPNAMEVHLLLLTWMLL